jgi:uncharacterized protein YigE (DUF2233 family)
MTALARAAGRNRGSGRQCAFVLAGAVLLLVAGATGEGIRYRPVSPGGVPGWLLSMDLQTVELRVLNARDFGAAALTAHEFRRKSGARAVWNASFFDEKGAPLGLIVAAGRQLQPVRAVDWGVFWVDGEGAHIRHRKDWVPTAGLTLAVESGPRLVVEGEPVRLRAQSARRTAICVRGDGVALVLVADGELDAARMAEDLKARGCVDALNLDGGPSTQLSLDDGGDGLEVPGGWPVPIALGAFSAEAPQREQERHWGCGR